MGSQEMTLDVKKALIFNSPDLIDQNRFLPFL